MKRVCFLVDSIFTIGGVQRVTAVIARRLSRDCDVTIVTFDRREASDQTLYGLTDSGIAFRFVAYPPVSPLRRLMCKAYSAFYLKAGLGSRWLSCLYARSSFPSPLRQMLGAELQQGRYDVIVGVHAPLAARLATLRPFLPGVRLVGWLHNSFEALFNPGSLYLGPARKRHYVWQFRQLDAVVTLCQHDADAYQHYDTQFRPAVVYNPLTLEPGLPSEGSSHRFLAVGRFTPLHKGFDLLIDAFHLFAQTDSEWKLDIVGEGPEEELYRKKISEYGLEDRIVLHPFTNNPQSYYSQAQVYVLSSRWEGMPLVLVEAMSHGLPVVSSDLSVCHEIMGEFGLYFRNGDAADLACSLREATLADWPSKSREALDIARRFDVEVITRQWEQLLNI